LAIELAGSLLGVMPLNSLRQQIEADSRFVDLAPAATRMGQSQGEAVKWSIARLNARDRAGFAALSVFRGGWDLSAAQTVLGSAGFTPADAAGLLAMLCERSLIRFSPGEDGRYSVVEPIRQAGADYLLELGESGPSRAHREHYRRMMIEAHSYFESSEVGTEGFFARVAREVPNLRVMLADSIEAQDASALTALPGLCLFWTRRGQPSEGAAWVDRVLDHFDPTDEGEPLAWLYASHIAMWSGNPDVADSRLDRFAAAADELDLPLLIVRAHHARGNLVGWGRGTPASAIDHFKRAGQLAQTAGLPLGLVSFLSAAYMLVRVGRFDEAQALLPQLDSFSPAMPEFVALGLDQVRGLVDLYQGEIESAIERLERSYKAAEQIGIRAFTGPLLIPLGWALLASGDLALARATGLRALTYVRSQSGGWRLAEPWTLLGAVALKEGDLEASRSSFVKALELARRAPEHDLIAWAMSGLFASAASLGASEACADIGWHAREALARHQLHLPAFLHDWWFANRPAAACSSADTPDEVDHVLHLARKLA
jgi:tetratricopeptide (TPR) repeat protein